MFQVALSQVPFIHIKTTLADFLSQRFQVFSGLATLPSLPSSSGEWESY